jgi:hypothetical protein
MEYDREGCSYHAKGLWIDWPHTDLRGPVSNPSTPTVDACKRVVGEEKEERQADGEGAEGEEGGQEGGKKEGGKEEERRVCVTMAGSSNMDQRGFERDVESEVRYFCFEI